MIRQLSRLEWQHPIVPRRWLRALYRKLYLHAGRGAGLPFECDFFGMRYAGDISNVIDFHCFFYGAFEKGQLFFWRDVALGLYAGRGVFVDVGANVGQHSLFMAPHCSAVHAFEPYPPVRARIVEKIRLNGLTHLVVHGVGLGDVNARLPFHAPAGSNLGVGSFVAGQADREAAGELLEVVIGDEYLARELRCPVQMLKLDVEGFEKRALAGLRRTLAADRPVVVVELTLGLADSFASQHELAASLPPDYRCFVFDLRDRNGKKDRAKSGAFRKRGRYRLVPFDFGQVRGQVDLIAFPQERLAEFARLLPQQLG